jgi:vitamin B12 transporter
MKGWILACIAVLMLFSNAIAEEKTYQMEQMVVTANRIKEKREDVITNVSIVEAEQIEQSPAQDLGGLLLEEGFSIIEYPNSKISVGIRGFRSDTLGNDLTGHVLILINGRRAGTGNLAEIPLDNVARVEIIRGPGSVQYGSAAMGGVVNVITKQGQGKPSVSLEQTLGSWNYRKTGIQASTAMKAFDLSCSASVDSQDDYSTADGDTYYNTGYDFKQRISVNAGWAFLPGNRIGLTYTGYAADDVGSPSYLSQNDRDDHVDNSLDTYDISLTGQNASGFLQWTLRYFAGKEETRNYVPENFGDSPGYTRDTDQRGGQAQVTAAVDHAHLTAGFDWVYYAVEDTYSTGDNTYNNPAGFLLAKLKVLDERLIISAGGRYDAYEVKDDESNSTDDANWSSSLGTAYKIIKGVNLRANYAEAFRMPTAEELYMFDDYSAWGFGVWSGNPDLKPETSSTYEVGLDISRGPLSTSVTYFYTVFDDYIQRGVEISPGVHSYQNVDGATISGIEGSFAMDLSAIFDWDRELKPYASFTYLSQYTDAENDTDLLYVPQWSASYGVEFADPAPSLTARLNFTYVSEQDINDYEETGDTTLDAYMVADLTISKELLSFDRYGRILLNADITNLFNADYAVVQGYPSPGRTFFVGLKYLY